MMNNYDNPVLDRLPNHLKRYIVEQNYDNYTPVDQAVWRYVMRQNYSFLKDIAYYPYIPGLKKAGLSIERIPDLQSMNDHLKQIGWGAVTVSGLIPSQAFMQFQACKVLIIAADIRQLQHIAYTPAPDIIHESAGHAPIIGEPDYARYLQLTGQVGIKALSSRRDQELFEAIRNLAILKELAGTPIKKIKEAEEQVQHIQSNMGTPSEMALLARLHWWTVEYGLIGTVKNFKIYGAGLLSSIGESASCLRKEVLKLPYTIDAANYAYDVTLPQPQLFVTPDFDHLCEVLDSFADAMAYRRGGTFGLQKAIESGGLSTVQFDTGLEVSGSFAESCEGYIKSSGATSLAYKGRRISGHDKGKHPDGFAMPYGTIKGGNYGLQGYLTDVLGSSLLHPGQNLHLEFSSGISVKGVCARVKFINDNPILVDLTACEVKDERTGETLFDPSWGEYTLACGKNITSVYAGAADKNADEPNLVVPEPMPVSVYDTDTLALHDLYKRVREIREWGAGYALLPHIWKQLKSRFPGDWLLALEMLEMLRSEESNPALQEDILSALTRHQIQHPQLEQLIDDGLKTLDKIF